MVASSSQEKQHAAASLMPGIVTELQHLQPQAI